MFVLIRISLSFQKWYYDQVEMLSKWLTERLDKSLHPFQCTCLAHIVKVSDVTRPPFWKMASRQKVPSIYIRVGPDNLVEWSKPTRYVSLRNVGRRNESTISCEISAFSNFDPLELFFRPVFYIFGKILVSFTKPILYFVCRTHMRDAI